MKDGFLLYKEHCTYLVTYSGKSVHFFTQRNGTQREFITKAIDHSVTLRVQNYLLVRDIMDIQIDIINYFSDRGYRLSNAFTNIETVGRDLGIGLV